MADLSLVVNVGKLTPGRAVAKDNMNVVAIITSELGVLNSNNRYGLYRSSAAVEADFGTASEATIFAQKLFGTSPNPVSGGAGVLAMGYWRSADETVVASAGVLKGEQLSEATVVPVLQAITDGSYKATIDGGVELDITGLAFNTISTLEEAVTILDTSITGATITLVDQSIIVTSDTTGASSSVTFFSEGSAGTSIGSILGLNSSSLATITAGADSSVLVAETKLDAISALKALVNFKGGLFVDNPTDPESLSLATWAQANDTMLYDVFDSPTNLEKDASNPVWQIKLAGQKNYRMMYSKGGNRRLAATYMARNHVVLFDGANTALTMHLKELSVPAEVYSDTEIAKAQAVGLDLYLLFGNNDVPKLYTSGANGFTDEVYNQLSYFNAVQVGMFNLYGTTSTKIAQDQEGIDKELDTLVKITEPYVRANVISPGPWKSPDTFGELGAFTRNIETNGYYFISGSLADQALDDYQARKSPTKNGAIRFSGAFHSVSVILQFA